MTENFKKKIKNTSDNLIVLGNRLNGVYEKVLSEEEFDEKDEVQSIHYGVEKEALNMRSLYTVGKHVLCEAELDSVMDILDISCQEQQSWLKITIPTLLPHKEVYLIEGDYIIVPLKKCLEKFQEEDPIERFEKCIIAFVHCYDVSLGADRIWDYDNIEFKQCLDVIERTFLENDSGIKCSVFQTSKFSDRDKTEIYIMDPSRFERWLEKYAN